MNDTVEVVRPGIAAAGLSLHVTTDPACPRVQGHPNQLLQVILNLLNNAIDAIDATRAGGNIRVVTRSLIEAAQVELEVTDDGSGIPPAQQRQIFQPFFSTKEPGRGTGLGLFISSQIVREHKGRIDVTSAEGRGSTFRVRLPILVEPT